jgi:DNA-binding MarR family transcriptional regulator
LLEVEPITLSRIVDRLQESGLVERSSDPTDRRAWLLHVTVKAQPLVAKLKRLADEMIAEAFAGIDGKDIETTRRVLAQARENALRNMELIRASNQ